MEGYLVDLGAGFPAPAETFHPMKIFISWSGDLSKAIAEVVRAWIPAVIQAVKPYYSPTDIEKGTRWSSDIARELESSGYGIICLTRNNLNAPWIMFEAGALSKNLGQSRVCPILFDVEPADISGPLVQFQVARFEKAEIWKLIKSINLGLCENALGDDVLSSVFEMWWPRLEMRVAECMRMNGDLSIDAHPMRTEKDMLEEMLGLIRAFSKGRQSDAGESGVLQEILRLSRARARGLDSSNALSVWIDVRSLGHNSMDPFEMEIRAGETIGDFLNNIWFQINDEYDIPAYTYGVRWVIQSVRSGRILTDIGTEYMKSKGKVRDSRLVSSLGLEPLDILKIIVPLDGAD